MRMLFRDSREVMAIMMFGCWEVSTINVYGSREVRKSKLFFLVKK